MNEDAQQVAAVAVAGVIVVAGIYLLLMAGVGFVNAQNKMNWCQWKNGDSYGIDSKETGKRWEPNALALGFTGECVDPGDKGL